MPERADVLVAQSANLLQFNGGGTNYLVKTPSGSLYLIYVDTSSDLVCRKSMNGGFTWSNPIAISGAVTMTQQAIWYDRWSGIDADVIHIAYVETALDAIIYRPLDTLTDTVGASAIVFDGGSTAAGGALSITRARGGNIVVAGSIDAGAEDGAWRSTDGGSSFGAIADPSEGATQDQYLLLPGWNADNQDVMLIFWDASAANGGELSVKRYDNSLNSWAETSIATSMTDLPAATAFPNVAAAVDLANSRNVVTAWSAVDTLNADLRCWTVNDTSISEVTNVVQNSTDDQGLCAIGIDTERDYWYVFYGGKSDGSETWLTNINVYYKTSTDQGSTWGPETQLTTSDVVFNIKWLVCTPRFTRPFYVAYNNDQTLDGIRVNVPIVQPRTQYNLIG